MKTNQYKKIHLYGRIILTGYIKLITGLHIGKGREGVMIGGVDNPVIRDVLTNLPFIPGSSLKGKLRSLAEKSVPNLEQNKNMGKGVFIHSCNKRDCPVCSLYGISGQDHATAPTRLIVRDVLLTDESKKLLENAETDLPYTEVKNETSIDRVTSMANPRPLERVPADALFGPFEILINLYENADAGKLADLLKALQLLEDDYLGGSGSRGSGKVKFERLKIVIRPIDSYVPSYKGKPFSTGEVNFSDLLDLSKSIIDEARKLFQKNTAGEQ